MDKAIGTDGKNKTINAKFYESQTFKEEFVVNTAQVSRKENGSYTIIVTVVDNAGNSYSSTPITTYKDIDNPYITGFEFVAKGTQDSTGEKLSFQETDYGFYFTEDTQVTISAKDDAPSSKIREISYYTIDKDGIKSDIKTVPTVNDKITFTVRANFKGQIYATVVDNVGNIQTDANSKLNYVNPNSTIIETPAMHATEKHITIDKAAANYTDKDGLSLYANNTSVSVVVADSYSGLRKVEWAVTASTDTVNNQRGSFEIGNDGKVINGGGGWTQTKTDKNLVTEMKNTLSVTNNSNNIKVYVKITDRAGNTSEGETSLSIDKTAPTIQVVYDNNTPDPEFKDIYKADRTATITIAERNFNPNDVNVTITNTATGIPQMIGSVNWTASASADNTTHSATIHYSADGDYTFDVSYRDVAGNSASPYPQDRFTIDKTLPVVAVNYNNNDAENADYYKAERIATITITEHNFETGRVKVTLSATDDGNTIAVPTVSNWGGNGDTHTATIIYAADARYTFDIDYNDKAGNNIADFAVQTFYVDKTAPTLTITGVKDKSANNNVVIPIINYNDTNWDKNSVKITMSGANHGSQKLNGEYTDKHNGQTYTLKDFEKIKENDDIYTLSATLKDLAGNQSAQIIQFSVNRFGSVFTLSDSTKNLNGKYVKQEQDIVITETNVDAISVLKLKLTVNGTIRDLVKDKDFTVKESGGNGEWHQYVYTIKKSLFENDGTYKITLYTEDMAGNINENEAEDKAVEISFGIDKTKPVIHAINIVKGQRFNTNRQTLTFTINDNLKLENVKIFLNGEEVSFDQSNNTYTIEVSSLSIRQVVSITAVDAAGNESETFEVGDFLVTTNAFWLWFYNTPLFVGSIIVIVVLGIGLTLIVVVHRRKRITNA